MRAIAFAMALAAALAPLPTRSPHGLGIETGVAGAGGDPAGLAGVTWRW